MGYSLAIGPMLVQLPQSRAVVPQSGRQPPRIEEILGTARVIRQDENATKSHSRTTRRDAHQPGPDRVDPDGKAALSLHRGPEQTPPTIGHLSTPRASATFVAQVLGQASAPGHESVLRQHRNGAELGSIAYRQAGGEPDLHPSTAALFRFTV